MLCLVRIYQRRQDIKAITVWGCAFAAPQTFDFGDCRFVVHLAHIDPIGGHDARGRIRPLHIYRVPPSRLLNLIEPGIQCSLDRWLLFALRSAIPE